MQTNLDLFDPKKNGDKENLEKMQSGNMDLFNPNKPVLKPKDNIFNQFEEREHDIDTTNQDYLTGKEDPIRQNIEEIRAQRQSNFTKTMSGIGRVGVKALSEVAKMPGMVGGLIAGIGGEIADGVNGKNNNSMMETMFNNAWIRNIEDTNQYINNEALPVYIKESVKNGNIIDNLTSIDFWATEGADGVGYIASMFVPGAALKSLGMGKLMMKGATSVSKGLFKSAQSAQNALKSINATEDGMNVFNATIASTFFESGAEAGGAMRNFEEGKEDFIKKLKNKNPNLTDEELEREFNESKASLGRNIFWGNVGILIGPNLITNKILYGAKKGATGLAKKAGGGVEVIDKSIKSKALDYTGEFGKGFAREGFWEEAMQSSIEHMYTQQANKGENDFFSGSEGLVDSYLHTVSTVDGQKAIALGGLLGGPMNVYSKAANDKATKKRNNELAPHINNMVEIFSLPTDELYEKDENGNLDIKSEYAAKYKHEVEKLQAIDQMFDNITGLKEMNNGVLPSNIQAIGKAVQNEFISAFVMPFVQQGEVGIEMLEMALESTEGLIDKVNESNSILGSKESKKSITRNIVQQAKEMQEDYTKSSEYLKYFSPIKSNVGTPLDIDNFYKRMNMLETITKQKKRFLESNKIGVNSELSKLELEGIERFQNKLEQSQRAFDTYAKDGNAPGIAVKNIEDFMKKRFGYTNQDEFFEDYVNKPEGAVYAAKKKELESISNALDNVYNTLDLIYDKKQLKAAYENDYNLNKERGEKVDTKAKEVAEQQKLDKEDSENEIIVNDNKAKAKRENKDSEDNEDPIVEPDQTTNDEVDENQGDTTTEFDETQEENDDTVTKISLKEYVSIKIDNAIKEIVQKSKDLWETTYEKTSNLFITIQGRTKKEVEDKIKKEASLELADEITTDTNFSQKADIERRRQEELSNVEDIIEIVENDSKQAIDNLLELNSEIKPLDIKKWAKEDGLEGWIRTTEKKLEGYDKEKFPYIRKFGVRKTLELFVNGSNSNTKETIVRKNEKEILRINAKYDAELAALKTNQSNTENQNNFTQQDNLQNTNNENSNISKDEISKPEYDKNTVSTLHSKLVDIDGKIIGEFKDEAYDNYIAEARDKKGEEVTFKLGTPGSNKNANIAIEQLNKFKNSNIELNENQLNFLANYLPIKVIVKNGGFSHLFFSNDEIGYNISNMESQMRIKKKIIKAMIKGESIKSKVSFQYPGIIQQERNEDGSPVANKIFDENGKANVFGIEDLSDIELMFSNSDNLLFNNEDEIVGNFNRVKNPGQIYIPIKMANGRVIPMKINQRRLNKTEAEIIYKIVEAMTGNSINLSYKDNLQDVIKNVIFTQEEIDFIKQEVKVLDKTLKTATLGYLLNNLYFNGNSSKNAFEVVGSNLRIKDDLLTHDEVVKGKEGIIEWLTTQKNRQINKKQTSTVAYKKHVFNTILSTDTVIGKPAFGGNIALYIDPNIGEKELIVNPVTKKVVKKQVTPTPKKDIEELKKDLKDKANQKERESLEDNNAVVELSKEEQALINNMFDNEEYEQALYQEFEEENNNKTIVEEKTLEQEITPKIDMTVGMDILDDLESLLNNDENEDTTDCINNK